MTQQQIQITPAPQLTRLVVMDGMLSAEAWLALGLEGKEAWLAQFDPIGIRAQASVLAVASQVTVEAVLKVWTELRIISRERANDALTSEARR